MIRPVRVPLCVSTLALFAVACSAAPPGQEPTGTSAQAVTAGSCASQAVPLQVIGRVCTTGDQDEGVKIGCWTGCVDATSSPVAPAGGYPPNAIPSCSGGNPVPPPAMLAGCTAGYAFTSGYGGYEYTVAAFLCPPSVLAAVSALEDGGVYETNPAQCTTELYSVFTPNDGCFGPPLDPTWGYVEVVTESTPPAPAGGCASPGGCGSLCPKP